MKKLFCKPKRLKAFSLAEVLIVLAIMGILIMLVVPNQTGIATRAKSMEAQSELRQLQSLQNNYRLQFSKFSMDLNELNYIPHKPVTEGGNSNYRISVTEASATSFKGRAEAIVDFNGDGKMNIWEIDTEGNPTEVQPD
jgi:type IV pilus assembly protein PilE